MTKITLAEYYGTLQWRERPMVRKSEREKRERENSASGREVRTKRLVERNEILRELEIYTLVQTHVYDVAIC